MKRLMENRNLGSTDIRVSRLGLGLAAVARPGYITLGRDRDLPAERSPEALYQRCAELLNAALDAGIRYVDVARSYGRAEEFLARWLAERSIPRDAIAIGSKWGYEYTAGWSIDAAVHEQKEHSLRRFQRQLAESRAVLGDRIDLYQIHSATLESGVLENAEVLAALVRARAERRVGAIGLTLSGPQSAATLSRAMELSVDGVRAFDAVQATCNILEPSLSPLLAEVAAEGMGVIVKEVHANGRLTPANRRPEDRQLMESLGRVASERGLSVDQLALAFVLEMPFVDVVISGAATVEQLRSHVGALAFASDDLRRDLAALAENPDEYWSERSTLPWS